ncbi:hypothetical protein ABLE93_00705 [Xanthobacter sp. KR7-65]|uniref:hypothetical protein n=1 Tax=Xanthobacter sp. KR7-65 TaxID=3156612 RepID=UPI0032B5C300
MAPVDGDATLALPLTTAVALRLTAGDAVDLPHPPTRPGGAAQAAFLRLVVPEPQGVWQITVAAPAWIDVFVVGNALAPLAFSGVCACPGVRKSLRFRLPAGGVVLEISHASRDRLALVIERVAR